MDTQRLVRLAVALAVCAWAVVLAPTPVMAVDGDLDPAFGTGGIVTTAFPVGSFASAVAIQADGRIVAVGAAAGSSVKGEFAVARYDNDGTLDPTFDTDGMLTTPIAGGGDEACSVAIQADGRIVVAGSDSRKRFAVVRYLPDGALDRSFGGNGIVRTNVTSGDDVAYDMAIQRDGRIVVVGGAGSSSRSFAVVRYRRDGTLDRTFGGDGTVLTGRGSGVARALVIQPDGRVVATGFNRFGLVVARLRADGSLDPTFGGDGWVGRVTWAIFPTAVALQPNGKIVVGGDWDIFRLGLARFTHDGRLDATFGGDGMVRTHVGPGEQGISALVIQPNVRIVGVGSAGPHEGGNAILWRFVLARYLRDGTLDPSWGGGDGRVTTRIGVGAAAHGAAAQADGKIVVVGGAGNIYATDGFAVARYEAAGS
jgi:uncharacterized delta-60 repeat protein